MSGLFWGLLRRPTGLALQEVWVLDGKWWGDVVGGIGCGKWWGDVVGGIGCTYMLYGDLLLCLGVNHGWGDDAEVGWGFSGGAHLMQLHSSIIAIF